MERDRKREEGFGGRYRHSAGSHRIFSESDRQFRQWREDPSLSRPGLYYRGAVERNPRDRVRKVDEEGWQLVQSRRRRDSRGAIDSDFSRSRKGRVQHGLRFREWERRGLVKGAIRNPNYRFQRSLQYRPDSSQISQRINSRPPKPPASDFSGQKVYFEDFPNGLDTGALKKIFARYGVHGWVYVARKRNMRNLNFGFITIDGSRSIGDVIDRLNDIRIGPAMLKASRARYLAPRAIVDPKPKISISHSKRIFRESRRDERSFVDVVATKPGARSETKVAETIEKSKNSGKEGGNPNPPLVIDGVRESSLVLNPAVWKSRSCVVRVSNIAMIRNLYDVLSDSGFQVDFAAPSGDDSVIVAFDSRESLNNFMNEDWKALNHVLLSVDLISSDYVPNYCLVYVDFMGIPPVFICEEVIRDLASRYGKVVAVDSDLARPDRLDVVSCLVSVPLGTKCRELSVTLRNKEYKVYSTIRQGVGCDRCNSLNDEYSTESGSDSEGSFESGSNDREGSDEDPVEPYREGSGRLESVNDGAGHNESNVASPSLDQSNAATPSSGVRNNLTIQEEADEVENNEDALTFDVGRKIGVFTENQRKVVMDVLGGNR